MISNTASAKACANIALIKYWGNRIDPLRIPVNGSISMNLEGLEARTIVTFIPDLSVDQFTLNNNPATPGALKRVATFMDVVRDLAYRQLGSNHPNIRGLYARVESHNNFPSGAGIASSAAAFAALSLAASIAIGLDLDEKGLSRLARRGSGSACRSVPAGFVEWLPGISDADSYAQSIAPRDYWDLVDCIAVVSVGPKPVGSTEGHSLAGSSPLQKARIADTPRRLKLCRSAILSRDFDALATVVEQDSNIMHSVMITSQPSLLYWLPGSIAVMQAVVSWRKNGLPVCYTMDAGPNVHVLCPADSAAQIALRLGQLPGVHQVLVAHPGEGSQLILEE